MNSLTSQSTNNKNNLQLTINRFGLHYEDCAWYNENARCGPDTCPCHKRMASLDTSDCTDWADKFNTEVINAHIPYSFDWIPHGPKEHTMWSGRLTVKTQKWTSSICYSKKQARKELCYLYFNGVPNSPPPRNVDKDEDDSSDSDDDITVTIAQPQMMSFLPRPNNSLVHNTNNSLAHNTRPSTVSTLPSFSDIGHVLGGGGQGRPTGKPRPQPSRPMPLPAILPPTAPALGDGDLSIPQVDTGVVAPGDDAVAGDIGTSGEMVEVVEHASQKVLLVDQRAEDLGGTNNVSIPIPDDMCAFGDKASVFPHLTDRWFNFGTIDWSITQKPGELIWTCDLPYDVIKMLGNNPIRQPFAVYSFVRPQMEMLLQVNSTPFHQGMLILGIRYYEAKDTAAGGVKRVRDAYDLLQTDHVIINPSTLNTGNLKIPYLSQFDMVQVKNGLYNPSLYYCTLYLGVLSPLRTGPNGATNVAITRFTKFSCDGEQTRFYGQCPIAAVPQGQLVAKAVGYEPTGGSVTMTDAAKVMINGVWKPLANMVGGPGMHAMGDALLGASMVLDDNVDSMIGNVDGDRPNILADGIPVYQWTAPNLSNGDGAIQCRKLTMSQGTRTTHPPTSVPNEPIQQMSFPYLCSIWGLINIVEVNKTDAAGKILSVGHISPVQWREIDATEKVIQLTPTGFCANFFAYYVGDQEFKFQVVKTGIASCRLRVIFTPDTFYSSDRNDYMSVVFDCEENNEFIVQAPYMAPTRVAPIWGPGKEDLSVPGSNVYSRPVGFGRWQLILETPYVPMDTVSGTLQILIYHRGASNMSMYVPCPPKFAQYLPKVTRAEPQMEERTHTTNLVSPLKPSECLGGAVQFGEVTTMKEMMRRSNSVYSKGLTLTANQKVYFSVPVQPGTPVKRVDGQILTPMQAFHDCFRFYRGGMYYTLFLTADTGVVAKVWHDPLVSMVDTSMPSKIAYIAPQDFTINKVGYSRCEHNLAKEILVGGNGNCVALPIHVPFYDPYGFNVNSYDPTIDRITGPLSMCNGHLIFEIHSPLGGNVFFELYQSMGDDGRYYTFQGTPSVRVAWDSIGDSVHIPGNRFSAWPKTGAIRRSSPISVTPAEPQMLCERSFTPPPAPPMDVFDQPLSLILRWRLRCVLWKIENGEPELFPMIEWLKDALRSARRGERIQKKRRARKAVPQMLKTVVDSLNVDSVKIGAASALGSICPPLSGPAFAYAADRRIKQAGGILDNLTDITNSVKDTIYAIPDFMSKAVSGMQDSLSSLFSNLGSGFSSACVHLFTFFKSNETTIKIASFAGILVALGIVTFNIYDKVFGYLSPLFSYFGKSTPAENSATPATPQDDEPSIVEDSAIRSWIKFLLMSVGSVCGFLNAKSVSAGISHFLKEGMQMANTAEKFLKDNLDMISRFIYWVIGKENPHLAGLELMKERKEEIKKWAIESLEMCDAHSTEKILSSSNEQLRLFNLYDKGREYISSFSDCPREAMTVILNINRKLSNIVDRVGMRVGRGVHYEPISLWIHGKAGIGKSSCAKHMAIEIAKKMGVVCDSDPVFVRAPTTAYWNGYTGQPIVIIDDWGSIQEPSAFAALLADFVGICSAAEYNPQFAAIEEKDRVVSPRILVSCSNILFPNHNTICDRAAIFRRRDLCCTTRFAPWFEKKYPDIKTASDPRITKADRENEMSKYNHLQFHVLTDVLTEKDYDPTDDTLKWQSLDEVLAEHSYRLVKLDETRKARALQDKASSRSLAPDQWLERLRSAGDKELSNKVLDGIKVENSNLKEIVTELVKPKKSKTYAAATTSATPQNHCVCYPGFDSNPPVNFGDFLSNKCLHKYINKDTLYCDKCEKWQIVVEDCPNLKFTGPIDYVNLGSESCGPKCTVQDISDCRKLFDGWLSARNLQNHKSDLPWIVLPRPSWCNSVLTNPQSKTLVESFYSYITNVCTSVWDVISFSTKVLLTVVTALGLLYTIYNYYTFMSVGSVVANTVIETAAPTVANGILSIWQGSVYDAGKSSSKAGRVAAVAGRLATGQDSRDVKHLLHRNAIRVTLEDNSEAFSVCGIGVCNRFALVPYHVVARIPKATKVKLVTNGNTEIGGFKLLNMSDVKIHRIDGVDLCVFEFPRVIPCFRSILGLLPRITDINSFSRAGTLVRSPVGSNEPQEFTQFVDIKMRRELIAYDFETGRETMELRGFTYPKQAPGLCGAILFDDKHNKIMGMHVCKIGEEGCAQSIVRDWFDHITPVDVIEPDCKKPTESARVRPKGDFIPISAIPQDQVAFSPAKTSIIPSVCFELLGKASRFPVEMKSEGDRFPGHIALQNAIEKQTTPTQRWHPEDIKVAVNDLRIDLLSKCQPLSPRDVRPIQDAILGVPGIEFMESIRLSTSPGYPLNYLYKSSNKATFVDIDETVTPRRLVGLHPKLTELYNVNHAHRLNGDIPYSPYFDFLKDERLKPGKAPRLINGCPFEQTIEWRRYFMDFFASFTKSRLDSNHAIGINVRSGEWTQLADRLKAISPHIVTGDYSNFGPTLDSELLLHVGDIICEWYTKYTDASDSNTVRRVLMEELAYAHHVGGDLSYQTLCGSPSGNPFTAPFNSLVNALYIRLVWLVVMRGTPYCNMVAFKKYMYFCVYGDDFIAAVHPCVVDRFNCASMSNAFSKFGIRFTDVLKSVDNVRPFCPLSEASFLKHYFIPHPDRPGFYLAALEQSVIEDVPSFIHTPCPFPEEQALVNCDQAARLAYCWGRDYHKKVVSALEEFWTARGRAFTTLSWNQCDDLCFGSENGDPSFMKGGMMF